jgi:hypothetical protein
MQTYPSSPESHGFSPVLDSYFSHIVLFVYLLHLLIATNSFFLRGETARAVLNPSWRRARWLRLSLSL